MLDKVAMSLYVKNNCFYGGQNNLCLQHVSHNLHFDITSYENNSQLAVGVETFRNHS
jgi:hypothetical protein